VASQDHVIGMLALNQAWQRQALTGTEHGFLSVMYDQVFMEAVVAKGEALVLTTGRQEVAGYVLVNTVQDNPRLQAIQRNYLQIRPEAAAESVAFGYQAVLALEFHGKGAFDKLLQVSFSHYAKRYRRLVSTIQKDNHRSVKAHSRQGWQFFDAGMCWIVEIDLRPYSN